MSIYDSLNDEQKKGVYTTDGPVLILAGAGSGKTRVITHRIAYLIQEKGVNPWNVMAITFTNKAAGEMRERVDDIVGFGSESIWVSTFHSSCVKILRRYIDRLGYDNNFTIYDTDDQKTVIKEIFKKLKIDPKNMKERAVLSAISSAKNEMIGPERYRREAGDNYGLKRIGDVYDEYQKQLKSNNALDFDDLLVLTVKLFQENEDVLEYYQDRFRYIMVDEYQDTNTVQFKFVSLLARKYRNLCVVGDDDQSIYKFRGANIANILDFEDMFKDTTVIKLEQNYRSYGNILNAANEVIKNNSTRKAKRLWTEKEDGEKINFIQYDNAFEEADGIAKDIERLVDEGTYKYNNCACLYRTNAQSRLLEEKLIARSIPYKLFGGVNFYQRKEIKDILAYLKTIDNGRDDVAVKRIINVPKRGIGLTSIDKIQAYASENGLSFFDALVDVENIPGLGRAAGKINEFTNFIRVLRSKIEYYSLEELFQDIVDGTKYIENLKEENTEESLGRIENIDELFSKLADYESKAETPTLSGFLEDVALVADIDSYEGDNDYVVLMTIHSSKGLEFENVYLSGMEDGLFPSYMTITSDDPTEIEEERRLCYVAITRAMERLNISCARTRMIRGETQYNKVSRFFKEIPPLLLNHGKKEIPEKLPMGGFGRPASFNSKNDNLTRNSYGTSNSFGGFGKKSMSAADLFNSGMIKKGTETVEKSTSQGGLGYGVGDTVKHIKFGLGTVTSINDAGRDFEVGVNFQSAGTKKMFASFAKLKKV